MVRHKSQLIRYNTKLPSLDASSSHKVAPDFQYMSWQTMNNYIEHLQQLASFLQPALVQFVNDV